MKQLKTGYITTQDQPKFIELVNSTANNLYDPDVLTYPTLRILKSYNSHPVAFLPMQQALMLESLAVEPESSLMDRGQAFRDLVKGAQLHASSLGIKELYFLCKDENVLKVAEGHGFERVEYPVVRMKL